MLLDNNQSTIEYLELATPFTKYMSEVDLPSLSKWVAAGFVSLENWTFLGFSPPVLVLPKAIPLPFAEAVVDVVC